MATTPETWGKMKETRHRLENGWKLDIDWSLFPDTLKNVSLFVIFVHNLILLKCSSLQEVATSNQKYIIQCMYIE